MILVSLGRRLLSLGAWLLYKSMGKSWHSDPKATLKCSENHDRFRLRWTLMNGPLQPYVPKPLGRHPFCDHPNTTVIKAFGVCCVDCGERVTFSQ